VEEAVGKSVGRVQPVCDDVSRRMENLEAGRSALEVAMDKNTRSADRALTAAEKAMRAAERVLKGGGAPASSAAPVEEPEHVVVSQGSGPSTEQIMEHVRVRVIDLVNEHIGDKFATDRRLEEAMQAVEAMPQLQSEITTMRESFNDAADSISELSKSKVDCGMLESQQDAFKELSSAP